MTNFQISVLVFLQIAVILGACRLVGRLVRPLGQPQVVAEMITGVLLGPSLLGLLLPELQGRLFPKPTLTVIYSLAQIGLALYMFLVGLEFDLGLIRKRVRSAMAVSWAGILTPFLLGCGVAWLLRDRFPLFAPGVKDWEAMLFMGAAMSITAFPMLARIIYERGLAGTSLGTLALAAGSVGDAAAWCVLAVVLASFTGNLWIAVLAIGGGLLYAVLMLAVGRGWLERLLVPREADPQRRGLVIPFTLILVTVCAWLTDAMGIYAVFGAFILGVAMPRGAVARHLEEAMTPLTTGLLVPMFFVSSGLYTRIGLLDRPGLWGMAAIVLLVACLGKGIACGVAARLNGEPPRESFAIGALMNCRGLTELILLNIGLERGIITPILFTVMVLMAIVTTLMAMPAFNLAYGRASGAEIEARRVQGVGV
ncbi:MAG: cation:proton antiporter [Thermoanaerobaculia bacterium]